MNNRFYCSAYSLQVDEALFATASYNRIYFLLEYQDVWGEKALHDSLLPEPVRSYLISTQNEIPASKILLIKQHDQNPLVGITFYIAIVDDEFPRLYEFVLDSYQQILHIDVTGIFADPDRFQAQLTSKKLYLVCTHGRRDACCAKFGLPVIQSLEHQTQNNLDEFVWESSHVGGHRFAANVLLLPEGLLYGRLIPGDVTKLVRARKSRKVLLQNLRGNSGYPEIVQAADYYLRQQTRLMSMDSFKLIDVKLENENQRWQVSFTENNKDIRHVMVLSIKESGEKVFTGCKKDKIEHIKLYQLDDYRIESGG
jgi:hypothetical protein